MKEPQDKADTPDLPDIDIPKALDAWRAAAADPDSRALQERLYRLCAAVAVGVMKGAGGGPDTEKRLTPLDLANSFMLEVSQKGLAITVEGRGGLRRAIQRHWHATRDPAAHELWKTLSKALRDLAEEGRARRLDADPGAGNNHNDAQWTSAPGESVSPADPLEFERCCEDVPACPPPPVREWLPDGKTARKVISPANASELAARLLACAGGWVKLGDLFAMFRSKVHLYGEQPIDNGKPTGGNPPPVPVCPVVEREEVFLKLAAELAERIWQRATGRGLVRVLCGYFLPKFVREVKVRMEDLGPSSTVDDQNRQLKHIIKEELDPRDLLPPEADEASPGGRWHGRLVTETMARLETLCDCPRKNRDSAPSPDMNP